MTSSTGVAATGGDTVPLVDAVPIDDGERQSSYGTMQDTSQVVALQITEQQKTSDDGDDHERSLSPWVSAWYGLLEERPMLDPRSTVILVMAVVAISYSILVFGPMYWGAKSSTGEISQQPASSSLRAMEQVHLRDGILH